MEHGCDSVTGLNRIVANGQFADLVRDCERRYDAEAGYAAAQILERAEHVRVAIVAGPSSSGKTTTMIKVSEHLRKAGLSLKAINIDHYFHDLEKHPVDEFGDHDYETPEALNLELINEHIVRLLAGETVRTPNYDFKTGRQTMDAHEMSLAPNEILLIDSLHGLYHAMTRDVPPERKFRLYIETLGQVRGREGTFMRWADNRLLRRMIRDRDHRSLQPIQTLTHWHYVRRSELEHIISFIRDTDFIVNSAMPYELPILKHKLFRYITASRNKFKDDPKRLDAHIRANRVYEFLKPLKPVRDDSVVPQNSLIREFIGGSQYKY
jgi:uridine kinase